MNQLSNIKRRNATGTLGTPPKPEEKSDNLKQPENVESASVKAIAKIKETATKKATGGSRVGRPATSEKTAPFSTKLRPEFKKELKIAAAELELDMGDLIEIAVSEWVKKKRKAKS